MPELSQRESASRLRIYIGESDHWRGKPLYAALLDELRGQKIAGATVFRGAAGFGAHSLIHTTSIEALSMDLPIVVEAIDTPEKISAVLELLYPMVGEGLITRDEVQVIKYTHRYLNPLPADLPVSEVMTHQVVSFTQQTPIREIWQQMVSRQIKAAPVVDDSGKVIGILTDEDLLERAGIQQRLSIAIRLGQPHIDRELLALESSTLTAGDLMTTPALTICESATLAAATTLMLHRSLKRLPVVNDEGVLTGILSRLDILRQVVQTPQSPLPAPLHAGALRTVQDVMRHDFPIVSQDDDLEKIIEKFTQTGSTRLIVVDETGKAIGLISDSDVVARIQPEKQSGILNALRKLGKAPSGHETAFDLMSAGVSTLSPETSVVDATRQTLQESKKWLVAIDEHSMPVGLVDRQILLEALTSVYESKQ